MEFETIALTDETRKNLKGTFIKLGQGYTNYELSSSEAGEAIVLVNGNAVPLSTWDHTFNFLSKSGFRVLRYDFFGQGISDRPEVKYGMDLFIHQLLDLIRGLKLAKINLVGFSMGGGISIVFANRYPQLVKKLSLIDPIGIKTYNSRLAFLELIRKIPVMNNLLMRGITHDSFIKRLKKQLKNQQNYQEEEIDRYIEKVMEQMKYNGFLRAFRSILLNMPFTDLENEYIELGKMNIPVQLVWGEKDTKIPFNSSQTIMAAIPSISFHPIKDSGHVPHYTHPEEVNSKLLKFINE